MFKSFKRALAINRNKKIKIAEEINYTEDGKGIIEAGINKASDAISPFCVNNYKTINGEFANHLDSMSRQIPLKKDLEIHIYTDEKMEDSDKSDIAKAIKTYYAENFFNRKLELRRLLLEIIFITLIGVLFLIGLIFIKMTPFLFEIVQIAVWLFFWESIEKLVLQLPIKRSKEINCYRLISCKIVFKDNSEIE